MTDPISDAELAQRIHQFDQQHANAIDLATVVAAQFTIYRNAGMVPDAAASLVEMYLEAVLAQFGDEEAEE